MRVRPLLAEYKSFYEYPNLVGFLTWWNGVVIDDKKQIFSRKQIVLSIANTDGGSHVDPKLDENYYDLSRNHLMSWALSIDGISSPIKDFCLASIRQIGFEVDLTLDALDIDLWCNQPKS